MSKGLENFTNAELVSANYPWKDIKNNTGLGDGTPVDRSHYADYHQTFRKWLDLAGITPNGLPDNVANGYQYVEALDALYKTFRGVVTTGVNRNATVADSNKVIDTIAVANRSHYLPDSTTLRDGDVMVFTNSSAFEVDINPFSGDTINNYPFPLATTGDFMCLVLDKPNNNWVVVNYKITTAATSKIATEAIHDAVVTTTSVTYIDIHSDLEYTTPNDGITRKYEINFKGTGRISRGTTGLANGNTETCAGFYAIYNDTTTTTLDFVELALIHLYDAGGITVWNTNQQMYGSIFATTIVTLAPNTTIKAQFKAVAGSSISTSDAKLTIKELDA